MRRLTLLVAIGSLALTTIGAAQDAGPYKVAKMARVGGEGGWDYIYADSAGRRLYIPRRGSPAVEATTRRPAAPAVPTRLTSTISTRSSWSARLPASAARARRSIRSRAMASPAASRSRCLTPRQ